MSIEELYSVFCQSPIICTDSRKIEKNGIFFSLKGENFDGNEYAEAALDKGCSYAVIDDDKYYKGSQYILVENVLKTLQELAVFHRKTLKIPVIGITGTNGKTTTKELINVVLNKKYRTIATQGNLNNHIGVPKTILSITKDIEIAIIEMGANHIGEIADLCEISQPDFGIITNIGRAHIEGFGSYEGIIKTKSELYDWIKRIKGSVFVNRDNELLYDLSGNIDRITFGTSEKSDIVGRIVKANPFLELEWIVNKNFEPVNICSKLVGSYNFENIMAAIAIGSFFKVEKESIIHAIEEYIPTNNRSQIINSEKNTIIMDAYNANPSSMEAAINNFASTSFENKTVILGDMFELGTDSEKEHLKILDLIIEKNFSKTILVGNMFYKTNKDNNIPTFRNTDELSLWLKEKNFSGLTILIKGSRGVKMEKIIDTL